MDRAAGAQEYTETERRENKLLYGFQDTQQDDVIMELRTMRQEIRKPWIMSLPISLICIVLIIFWIFGISPTCGLVMRYFLMSVKKLRMLWRITTGRCSLDCLKGRQGCDRQVEQTSAKLGILDCDSIISKLPHRPNTSMAGENRLSSSRPRRFIRISISYAFGVMEMNRA